MVTRVEKIGPVRPPLYDADAATARTADRRLRYHCLVAKRLEVFHVDHPVRMHRIACEERTGGASTAGHLATRRPLSMTRSETTGVAVC
jgi:hypothetical protein